MPILMPTDTAAALNSGAGRCESRSLLQQKLVFFDEIDEYKRVALDLILTDGPADLEKLRQQKSADKEKAERSGNTHTKKYDQSLAFLAATAPLFGRRSAPVLKLPSMGWLDRVPAERKREFRLVTAERLIVGVSNGVLENCGLTLHRFLGVPFIPGSGLKGIARDAAVYLPEAAKRMVEIFGNDPDPDVEARQGGVGFLPAYPVTAAARLEYEICTPHYQKYYGGTGNSKALDVEDPIPNLFPVVAKGEEFRFTLLALARRLNPGQAAKLLDLAEACLKEALMTRGVGAKTAAGYGWFDIPGATKPPLSKRPAASSESEDPLIEKWRGKTICANFPAFLPDLAGITDDERLKLVFNAIIPAQELRNLKKRNPYWQSFASRPQGGVIMKRLGIHLT